MIACDDTISVPAARPWTARAMISRVMPCARAPMMEPAMNMEMPNRNRPLRPIMSPSLPTMGRAMVCASRKPVITHDMCSTPPSSPTMVGRAVEKIIWPSELMSIDRISAARISPRLLRLSSTTWAWSVTAVDAPVDVPAEAPVEAAAGMADSPLGVVAVFADSGVAVTCSTPSRIG